MKVNPADLGLKDAHALISAAIAPRPIAFVSTVGEDGVLNLAPFSAYASICMKPMMVGFSVMPRRSGQKKDTLTNVEFSKDFVINVVNEALAEAMNQASADYLSSVDEFKEVGLTPIESKMVRAPRVAESPIQMECRLVQILNFGEGPYASRFIIGEVVLVHVKDELYVNGEIEMSKLKSVGRLGGDFYCRTTDLFEMLRPESSKVG
jgi:flavin reductase (DIM6/NTAB) family NADH-FMN oxidoreductase RutF